MDITGKNILPKEGDDHFNSSYEDFKKMVIELKNACSDLKSQNEKICNEQYELKKALKKFTDLFHQSPVNYFVLSEEGLITDINITACNFCGASRNDLISTSILKFISPDYLTVFSEHLECVFKSEQLSSGEFSKHSCELPFINAENIMFFVRIESCAIHRNDTAPVSECRTVIIDITEQKKTKIELREAHAELEKKIEERTSELRKEKLRLAEAQQLAHIGNWEWNIKTNTISWSDELCNIIGMNPGEVRPTQDLFIEYVHPDDKAIALKSIEDAFNSDAVHVHFYRIVRDDGTIRNVEAITEIIKDSKGNPLKMYGTARDITGKIKTAEKLKEVALIKLLNSSAAAANMAETIEEAALSCIYNICEFSGWQTGHLYLTDSANGNKLTSTNVWYIDGNSKFQKLKGTVDLLLFNSGTNLSARVLADKKAIWMGDIDDDDSLTLQNAKKIGLRSGFAFPVLLKHEVIGVLEFFSTDVIKEDAQLPQVVTYIGTHLGRVEERKRAREELKIAKEKAEVSEQIKEQFLANISHEIRTPLNGILGFTNLLSETNLTKEQRKFLKTVKLSSDNLLDIVNNVLDISKIETGKITFEETKFDLKKLIAKTLSSVKPKIKAKKLKLQVIIEKEIPQYIMGDPLRLNQILLNLLSNAVKFTRKGNVELKIQKIDDSFDIEHLKFSVSDTGIGIRKEKLNSIFESFTQASSDTTRKYGGTGLGLAIAKQLVELQKGTIGVRSEVNKGSVFFFELQFKKCEPVNERKKKNNSAQGNTNQFTLKFARILVVEDNLVNRQLVRRLIESKGIEVDTAINGKVALKKILLKDYHLILMDLQMPLMDGYETARMIRSALDKQDIPIIAVTAHALKGEAEKCLNAGMNDYLSKPINPDELFLKINKYLFLEGNDKEISESDKISSGEKRETNLVPLEAMAKGNSKLIKEIASLFIKNTPQLLKKIETSLKAKNFPDVKLYVHKLRSSVKIIGMEKCDNLLCRIEDDILENNINTETFERLFETIQRSCLKATEEMKKEANLL